MKSISPHEFKPVMTPPLGLSYHLLDLSETGHFDERSSSPYAIGRFDEVRANLYSQPLFTSGAERRCVHMGVDLGGLSGDAVFSFDEGVLYAQGALSAAGDYGHTLIMEHIWRCEAPLSCGESPVKRGDRYWALYGHLSASSIQQFEVGELIKRGQQIGWLGDEGENGGWPPHLHFQLSRVTPRDLGGLPHDMPGAVTLTERSSALNIYPDPRGVLGDLY